MTQATTTCAVTDDTRWRAVLASGATAVPRWSRTPGTSDGGPVATTVAVPGELAAAVSALAEALGVGPEALLLAAHARVLAALTAEPEVLAGVAVTDRTLPCRLETGVASWRALVADAAAAVTSLTAADHADEAAALARARRDLAGLWPETVLGLGADLGGSGDGAALAEDTVFRVDRPAGDLLRVVHRPGDLDVAAAERLAGYHLTALGQLCADPDAAPGAAGLVGPEELAFQVDGLAGPERERPALPAHEIIRARAAADPDRVAVVHGDRSWTYRELDEVTDRIARALLARGLPPEGIVAVVAERTLDWAASVLGILKAGAAYLPLEPHFPPDRIATVLTRAQARLVLGERGSMTTLDEALASLGAAAPERLLVDDAVAEEHGDAVPRVEIAGDRLAYLYFTSGSTGEPKGAMCEHAGMVNHLYAKIEDLGITEGTVVTETAPQCFDISLWQLVAPWLVGGTTVLVEQETILDVPSFVDLLARRRVEVAQLVPSYLDVVVSYLEQQDVPAAEVLPALRRIAVTGEAVKKELVARWFSVRPDVAVVNAYGLTETCDDTNHEILTEVPAGERVPLGPAVPNVRVYVVDEALNPVPVGAPGEIVFSGVCVGRGYVNDPDRTAKAFVSDPLRPGERLYRSGDHGRWLPDGKLDFLGRRDHQVKISGFRIEIGEVENTLLRAPGVRDASVVVAERPGRGKQLVGFYGAAAPVETEVLRATLGAALPAYMVPPVLHHQETLPLTPNGKIDRKALTTLALALDEPEAPAADADVTPLTTTEARVAAVWAPLLGVDASALGRDTHFFDRGGSSLLAVKMAVGLKKAVSLPDIVRNPVLADLAALIDSTTADVPAPAPAPVVEDEAPTVRLQPSGLTPSS
ncbi:non-ribosomal peptide synthetase [Actinomycetospora sp. NBC_00405]|uniref:non-ribosomal peptide synthetase n=1 Tax=Actinomycetospora sp. NBC_00405 TaxID=2975952 RepID=UPI002E1BBBE8